MRTTTTAPTSLLRAALPYLATAVAVIEADRIIDIRSLAWPARAVVVTVVALDLM